MLSFDSVDCRYNVALNKQSAKSFCVFFLLNFGKLSLKLFHLSFDVSSSVGLAWLAGLSCFRFRYFDLLVCLRLLAI